MGKSQGQQACTGASKSHIESAVSLDVFHNGSSILLRHSKYWHKDSKIEQNYAVPVYEHVFHCHSVVDIAGHPKIVVDTVEYALLVVTLQFCDS